MSFHGLTRPTGLALWGSTGMITAAGTTAGESVILKETRGAVIGAPVATAVVFS